MVGPLGILTFSPSFVGWFLRDQFGRRCVKCARSQNGFRKLRCINLRRHNARIKLFEAVQFLEVAATGQSSTGIYATDHQIQMNACLLLLGAISTTIRGVFAWSTALSIFQILSTGSALLTVSFF